MKDDIETLREFIGISENVQPARDALKRLEKERDTYKKALDNLYDAYSSVIASRDSLRSLLDEAIEELEIYASDEVWMMRGECNPNSSNFRGLTIAREALAAHVGEEK